MKILIFTQDRELLDVLREETKKLLIEGKLEAKILSFYTLNSAVNELSNNPSDYDLVILDIDYIHNLRHVYTAFRVQNFLAAIIIASSSYKQLDAAMLLRPTAYFKKPLSQIHYRNKLKFVIDEFLSLDRFFSFKQKMKFESIPYCEIECFESNQRNVSIYLRNSKINTFAAKLNDIESKVPNTRFVRCHQSYLVNMENIRLLDKVNKQFHMVSGKKVDISRRNMSHVLERFSLFIDNRKQNQLLHNNNHL